MRVCIIIPTLNRSSLLPSVLAYLDEQTRPPLEVILSAPDQSHVVDYHPKHYRLSCVFGSKGLCAQRNRAMDQALKRSDIITFFDDDFLPAHDYIEKLVAIFERNPGWAVVTGYVAADGGRGPGLSFEEGLGILQRSKSSRTAEDLERVSKHVGAYGCNMSMRAAQIQGLRFDERLVLYGWQEDIDFTSRLRRHGDVVAAGRLTGVHLGVKSGRVSGVRLGYSQVCNPIYLVLKGTMPATFALELVSRNLLANVVKSFWPEPYIDRRGRLLGNFYAALHLLRGKVQPEYILNL
jgi:glycosyltransferase involved in cell wall biosynthesis